MPDGFCTFKIPLKGKAKDKIIQREEEIMKKFACFALTAALLLAGCGGTDGDNAAQSQTETGSAAQESTAQESTGQTEQEGTQTEGTQTESTEAASANGASIKAGDYFTMWSPWKKNGRRTMERLRAQLSWPTLCLKAIPKEKRI